MRTQPARPVPGPAPCFACAMADGSGSRSQHRAPRAPVYAGSRSRRRAPRAPASPVSRVRRGRRVSRTPTEGLHLSSSPPPFHTVYQDSAAVQARAASTAGPRSPVYADSRSPRRALLAPACPVISGYRDRRVSSSTGGYGHAVTTHRRETCRTRACPAACRLWR